MGTEENKAVYRRFLELGFNTGNFAALNEVLAPDYVDHDAPPGIPPGPDGIARLLAPYRVAFPDVQMTVDAQIAEGDRVATRYTFRGTHQGELMGMPPTGRHVTMTGTTIARIADGKMVEAWVNYDLLGMLQQLGAIPTPGQSGQ
jgi:steroid delta-isomerase-like uncharacterized protein